MPRRDALYGLDPRPAAFRVGRRASRDDFLERRDRATDSTAFLNKSSRECVPRDRIERRRSISRPVAWLSIKEPCESLFWERFFDLFFGRHLAVDAEPVASESETMTVKTEAVAVESEAVTVKTGAMAVESETMTVKTGAMTVESETMTVNSEAPGHAVTPHGHPSAGPRRRLGADVSRQGTAATLSPGFFAPPEPPGTV
jgi:hypothetical protein